MARAAIFAVLVLMNGAAVAADITRDQTFDKVFDALGSIQTDVGAAGAGSGSVIQANNMKNAFDAWKEGKTSTSSVVKLYSDPSSGLAPKGLLNPGTLVDVLAVQPDWVKVAPQGQLDAAGWVPASDVMAANPFVQEMSSGSLFSIDSIRQRLKDLAASMADNPYMTLKGFSVTLAVPPSVQVDFEMKQPTSAATQ